MVTIVKYTDIENLKPMEVVDCLNQMPKHPFNSMLVEDIFESNVLKSPFINQYYRHIFKRGTYLFFDSKNSIKYIGKAKDGFYPRLMGHITTDFRPGIGFNAALVKISIERGIPYDKLCKEDLDKSLKTLGKFHILLVDVEYNVTEVNGEEQDINNHIPGKLETILKKAFKVNYEKTLMNTNVGRLSPWESENNIKNIVGVC